MIRTGNSYSSWFEIIFGALQRSMLGPLLFNNFIADLCFILKGCRYCQFDG